MPAERGHGKRALAAEKTGCAPTDTQCSADERPGREVEVPAFWIEHEVTHAAYRACVQAGGCTEVGLDQDSDVGSSPYCDYRRSDQAEHPVVCVSWEQAVAYCQWLG